MGGNGLLSQVHVYKGGARDAAKGDHLLGWYATPLAALVDGKRVRWLDWWAPGENRGGLDTYAHLCRSRARFRSTRRPSQRLTPRPAPRQPPLHILAVSGSTSAQTRRRRSSASAAACFPSATSS